MFSALTNTVKSATGIDLDFNLDGIIGEPGKMFKPTAQAGSPNFNGRCRSLFIGINYVGMNGELRGCINDVTTMQNLLEHCGFDLADMRALTENDSIRGNVGLPTKANILANLRWLVEGAQPGDTLFLHYSGHGTSVKDKNGDEADGKDEALVPLDYHENGLIIDDDIYSMVAEKLPDSVRLTAVLDCCHSGSLMDLPFAFDATKDNLRTKKKMEKQSGIASKFANGPSWMKGLLGDDEKKGTAGPNVIMFSGCKDEQTSADVSNTKNFEVSAIDTPGGAGGACTNALTEILTTHGDLTFVQLLENMRRNLEKRKFTQVPQMSSSKPIDLDARFSFFGPFE